MRLHAVVEANTVRHLICFDCGIISEGTGKGNSNRKCWLPGVAVDFVQDHGCYKGWIKGIVIPVGSEGKVRLIKFSHLI